MKIVDAYWEKRNLGVDCVEVSIETTDDVTEIYSKLKDIDVPYVVIKVPSGRMDIMFKLAEWGFVYVESLINFTHDLKDIELSGIYKRINQSVSCKKMHREEYALVFREIEKEIFSTDRISIDPLFGKKIAARRYINWINDECERNSEIYEVLYKDQGIGFFTLKETEKGVFYPFLAGVYSDYATSGLGIYVIQKILEEAVRRDANKVSTYLSSNNLPVIKVHSSLGFVIADMKYVYIKHNHVRETEVCC